MFIFISGTSGSGKSSYAEERLEKISGTGEKFYIATAKIYDAEMRARVARHKAMRKDKGFITIERENNLRGVELPENSSVLIEALTTWLSNEMFDRKSNDPFAKVRDDFQTLRKKCANIILVSDEIFSDGVLYDSSTEKYIETLAKLHRHFAREADEVVEVAAGVPTIYKSNDTV